MPAVVPLYTALFAVMCIVLAVRVIGARRAFRVGIGHGGHAPLERTMRVHANFCEYVPLGLLALVLAELQGRPHWLLHGLCSLLLLGRLLHAVGVSRTDEDIRLRQAGMTLTFTVLAFAAALLFYGSLAG